MVRSVILLRAARPRTRSRRIAKRSSLDYLALGDWHGTLKVEPRTWYAGTPETDGFQRDEPGHALMIELKTVGCGRSEEPTSELQSLMRISYAVICWKKNTLSDKY